VDVVTPRELLAAIEAATAPRIIDVRTEQEFADGHVPGAINVPFQRAGALNANPAEPLIVYCGHGPRAWIAGRLLRRRGFTAVSYLRGHMAAWRRAALPEARGR
jgi:rhodanese-related sulfurtransferase